MKKILLILTIVLGITHAENINGYDTYHNGRFGFEVSYPSGELNGELNTNIFIPTGESANGDGQYFIQSTGEAVIIASGSNNGILDAEEGDATLSENSYFRDDCNLKNLLNNHNLDEITYKKQIGNTAVYSGFDGKNIVYVKSIRADADKSNDFYGDRCFTLTIRYPTNQKKHYDEIVKNVANSFKSSETINE